MALPRDPFDLERGIRLSAWLDEGARQHGGRGASGRRGLLRALGLKRPGGLQPAQATVDGMTVRSMAALSPYGERQTRGSLRSYLERAEADPMVLQAAPIEQWLDRWSMWIRADDPSADTHVMAEVLIRELTRRYGLERGEIYVVEHARSTDAGRGDREPHIHAVVPALRGMNLTREVMAEIGREIGRELSLDRRLDVATREPRSVAYGSAWNLAPTEAQMSVLRKAGNPGMNMTRGEASMVIELLVGERSWYNGRER